ncbi:TIGR03087 family PEP-CTERM/XrtA system glycosyltransferase [Paraglaciecola arctica]|uniref:TIGR03087 family PEP-CTERM/XrtA system glycosyltransferase n=1 Tax=Paraglaciecola arctica TaxID=1128911 RepID=UPI001C06E6BE|nr:TIGR03087 family PEP-CTERM/XrtA system glycosyltransferase [Paraglaciecola arctica]
MKILILSHRVPFPPNKGEKIRTFHQIQHLSELGHQIHLFSPFEDPAELAYFAALGEYLCQSVTATPLKNKAIRLLTGLIKGQSMSVANFYDKSLQQKFDQFLSDKSVDAIICSASSMAEYVFKSAVLNTLDAKPLLIMDFMDVDSDKWGQYQQSSRFPMSWVYAREQKLLAHYERQIVKEFDACYLIAQAEVTLFNQKVIKSDKIHVMGNGLDTSTFYPPKVKQPNPDPVFLFTGVMDYKPNEDAVIWFVNSCWPSIIGEHPNARFIIAGMNPSADIKQLAQDKGIEVTGFVEDILPYYHQADIFVAPFRLARGVQNKVLQAFACALPVISTPMGAEGILCQTGKDILIATTPEEFVTQANQLVAQPELAQSIGQSALQLIQSHYSWQGQLQPLVNLLGTKDKQ